MSFRALLAVSLQGGVAASDFSCTSGDAFCHQHLALTGDGAMRVGWTSGPAEPERPVVMWGSSPDSLDRTANATADTYVLTDLCSWEYIAVRGWEAPGYSHHASLEGLAEGDVVYYRVGDAARDEWGQVNGPVVVGPKRGQGLASFVAFGDMGAYAATPNSQATCHGKGKVCEAPQLGAVDDTVAAALRRAAPELDAAIHVGDLAYANDGPAKRWRYWMDEIEPTASTVPWMVGCGNHDCLYRGNKHPMGWLGSFVDAMGDGGECAIPMQTRFWMPGDKSLIDGWHEAKHGHGNNIFYSFDIGYVHIAMLSSEHDLSVDSDQIAWLERDLRAVDRQKTPFIILGQHRPLYSSTVTTLLGLSKPTNDLPETKGMRASIEPLLLRYGVTAVVAGHYHQYERSCPIINGTCASTGVVHVTAGIAGITHSADWLPEDETPEWVVTQNDNQYGYVRFDVANSTHIKVAAVDARDDSAFDEFWLRAASVLVMTVQV